MTAVKVALLLFGYPSAIFVISRWLRVVRDRDLRLFGLHQLGVAAIVAGWAIHGRIQGVVVNGSWFVVAALWYALGARRAHPR